MASPCVACRRRPIRGFAAVVVAAVIALSGAAWTPAGLELRAPAVQAAFSDVTTRVSVSSTGTQGNGRNQDFGLYILPSVSADGRYVAFASDSSNLAAGDSNNTWDVFVHDRETRETTRVSVSSEGSQGNFRSSDPSISADGRYVAFTSAADNLVPNDTNGTIGGSDVFVHDRLTGATTRVSVGSAGEEGFASRLPSISADGRFVAFVSGAPFVSDDTNGALDTYTHDRLTGSTSRVSVSSEGTEAVGYDYYTGIGLRPAVSGDGRYVAFASTLPGLAPGDTDILTDVFVRDRAFGTTRLVSADLGGLTPGNSDSFWASISADGGRVAFVSWASDLILGDTNGREDAFVRDLGTGTTQRVSVGDEAQQANGNTIDVTISGDGSRVAFSSDASNLLTSDDPAKRDTNGVFDVFVRDLLANSTVRASVDSGGGQANGHSFEAIISGDGRQVAFESYATNLVLGDTNGFNDVFARAVAEAGVDTLPVIFIHGITGNWRSPGFGPLLDPLRAEFGDRVTSFAHYQDVGNRDPASGHCDSSDVVLPQEPTGGMPVDMGTVDPSICDSEGDLALNAVLLHRDVQEKYHAAGNKPVVLIANSMGAAIVRGMLAYSAERGDNVATDMVDSVFYLEGAHAGSLWFKVNALKGVLGPIQDLLIDHAKVAFPANLNRPAATDLESESQWYRWVNPPELHIVDNPSFNAYGDIRLYAEPCVLFGAVCWQVEVAPIGDIALMPGSDDEKATPFEGGARFLVGAPGSQNWEWAMTSWVEVKPWEPLTFIGSVQEAAELPQYHGNFGNRMHEILVADCQTGQATPFDEALLRLIRGRIVRQPYLCQG